MSIVAEHWLNLDGRRKLNNVLFRKKGEIVCFFTKGGVPPRFSLGKKVISFRGLVFYGGGVPPTRIALLYRVFI